MNIFLYLRINKLLSILKFYFGGKNKKKSIISGEKVIAQDEFLTIYSQAKKDKDQGVFDDFIECLKLYDKEEKGQMAGTELLHILLTLGKCFAKTKRTVDYTFLCSYTIIKKTICDVHYLCICGVQLKKGISAISQFFLFGTTSLL